MPIEINSLEDAATRLKEIAASTDKRVVIGIVGKPGAGKSTLSEYLSKKIAYPEMSVLPMDGFHMSNKVLVELGRLDRKGAEHTFDSHGFVSLLKRVREETQHPIYYPVFHREIEESIAGEGTVLPETRIILTEGNYLLYDKLGWEQVKDLLDESWVVTVNDDHRIARLIDRHVKYGRTREEARERSLGSDEINAQLIESTFQRADVIVNLA
jgi:pantothenate kinase